MTLDESAGASLLAEVTIQKMEATGQTSAAVRAERNMLVLHRLRGTNLATECYIQTVRTRTSWATSALVCSSYVHVANAAFQ